jgi:type VI secretion system protein ImpC
MASRIELGFRDGKLQARERFRSGQDQPMRILVMGDFSGRANRGVENAADLADRPTVAVDVDNFDRVISGLVPCVHLPLTTAAGPSVTLEFHELGDFHPDQLYRRLELFKALREMRGRLHDPASFAQAARDLRGDIGQQDQPGQAKDTTESEAGSASLLEQLLGGKPAPSAQARAQADTQRADIQQLIKHVVAPYIVADGDPLQPVYVASLDAAISEQMRALLHQPAFQAMESAWRGLHRLVTGLELAETLQLHLLDVSKDELLADIGPLRQDLQESGLYRLLVEQGSQMLGGQPWSVLVGNYTFGMGAADVALLASLGAIASQAGGPFLAGAEASVIGCRSLADSPDHSDWQVNDTEGASRWQALRSSPLAPWLGLALPRLLLRLPYGKETDPAEQFEFEEFTALRQHEELLWGNPALACAMLLGQSFSDCGWEMEPGDQLDIADLPAYSFERDGETELQACAEAYLTERAGEAILQRGLMPLLSYKNRNAVRVMRFQALAQPAQPLVGPWR